MDSNQAPSQDQAAPSDDNQYKSVYNPLEAMRPGERIICEIRRHPIGLFGIYLTAAVVIVLALGAAAFVSYYMADLSQQAKLGIVLGATLVVATTLLYSYIASMIYNANRWVVTSDSLTQISQTGLLDKQSSQLSLGNLEDVTVQQDGLLQTMFGFGNLRVETAGERSKFTFLYCPNPNDWARKIIAAHEAYVAANPDADGR